MKVYKKAEHCIQEINSKTVADDFNKASKEIANIVSKLNEIKSHADYLHEITNDNGDVGFELSEVLEKLGVALAVCIIYATEYEDEANDTSEN